MVEPLGKSGPERQLQRVDRFDDRRLVATDVDWPVEVPSFEEGRFHGAKQRALYVLMKAAQETALRLPGPLQRGLVASIAGAGRALDKRHTAAAEDYIRAALPLADDPEVDRLVGVAWKHLLRVALVTVGVGRHVMGRRLGDHYEISACPEALEVLESPRGSIMLSAHAGFWEACCPAIVGMGWGPSYGVGKAPRNDFVARDLLRMRERQGMRVIPRRGAMSAVPAAVRAGASVGMLLDHRPRQKPIYAPFFGRLAACDRSAGVLLRRVKAPLVFYGCYSAPGTDVLDSWRFELRLPKVIQPEELAGLDPETIAARINSELEQLILHRPEEAFWLHDRFRGARDATPGESAAESRHAR
ncbi:MAG: lysophospholipid acyltransferase family protein [Planctomycetota bacterium]|nr:lysophospholipid acyltransferase family protein [Planctomycetota bacterium]